MKNAIFIMICALLTSTNIFSQSATVKTETFKVYGNCDQCKTTIEGSLKKKDGIVSKNWDVKTKMISVTYDPNKVTLTQIKQKIAGAGYDTDEIRSKDEAYYKLHKCC